MNPLHWDLDALYPGFDSEEFKRDLEGIGQKAEDFVTYAKETLSKDHKPEEVLFDFINKYEDIYNAFIRLMSYSHLSLAVNSDHPEANDAMSKLYSHSSSFALIEVLLLSYVKDIDLKELIEKDSRLKDFEFFLSEIKLKSSRMLSEKEEVLYSKLRSTGSTAWSKLQEELTSFLTETITLDGKEQVLTLTELRNLAYDKNPEVRKSAYEAELKALQKIERPIQNALLAIKGEVIEMSKLRGYSEPLEQTLEESRMDRETLDALLQAMKESLPMFRRYLKAKAKYLGHSNGLPFYDLFAPIGSSDKTYTYEGAIEYLVKNFEEVSPRLSSFIQHAYDNKWLDVEPRPGKRGGAFCSTIHGLKESRILANFSGNFSSVTTLAHELGHAYHSYNLKDESLFNADYSMPIAETASTFNETLITKLALKDASGEEAIMLLEDSISGSCQVIVDIYSRFLFESNVFRARTDRSLSVSDLNELMLQAQRDSYGDGLDPELLHRYMWIVKGHYYSGGLSFYNFPYAFGQLFAKGLYAMLEKEGPSFMKKYDELLNNTGRMSIYDAAKSVGVDVHDVNFFRASLKTIEEEIDEFIRRTQA
ncbi:M3 family oligoendopeptidase [Guggenheimella bovis]